MADYTATLPSVDVAPLLWALPLLPAAGAALAAWLTRPGGQPDERPVGRWAPAVGTWLGLLAACSVSLRLGGSKALVAAGPGVLRVGSLDLHLGLTLDAPAALGALVLLVIASLAQLGLRLSRPGTSRAAIEMAVATGAGVLGLMASCPVAALGAVGVVAWRAGALRTAAAGAALAAAGAALVGWGLTGAWGPDSFVPGGQPHYVAILREKQRSTALTMAASPGAQVQVDGAPAASAPFAQAPLAAGPHGFTIDPGPGADASEIRKVRVPDNAEAVIVRLDGAQDTLGAAMLLRAREDEGLAVPRGRLGQGRRAGLTVASWSGALLGLGLLLMLVPGAARGSGGGRAFRAIGAQTSALLLAGLLGSRWLPLWGLGAGEGGGWLAVALLAGGGLLALAGLWQPEPGRAAGFGAGASASLGLAAMAAGSPEAGLTQVAVAAAAQALLLWGVALVEHLRPEADWELGALQGLAPRVNAVRWLKLGYAALVGLLPVGFGALEALRALGPARGLGALPLAALVGACLGRLVYRLSEGDEPVWQTPRNVRRGEADEDDDGGSPGDSLPAAPAAALAALVVALGPLGASTLYRSPVGEWLAGAPVPRGPEAPASVWNFLILVALGLAALAGARWARGRHGAGRARDEESAPAAATPLRDALGRLGAAVVAGGAAVAGLEASVEALAGATGDEAATGDRS